MNKALFLDRDGVINKEINYLHKVEDVEFLPGIFEISRLFLDKGYRIFIVTNQAGIARGYYSEADFRELTDWMVQEFKNRDIEITKVYYCPFHPTEGVGHYKMDSYDRKPHPGMLFKARDEFDLNLQSSFLIGDKESDIEAGVNAGVGTTILLTTARDLKTQADRVVPDLSHLGKLLKL